MPACRQLELVRDTLMDDARERVDLLGEEATQNESLGAALEQAYAARFAQGVSSAPAGIQQPQQSSAEPNVHPESQQDMCNHGSAAPTEAAAGQEVPEQASEAPQPDLAPLDQSAKAEEGTETAAGDLTARQPEPSTVSEPVQEPSSADTLAEAGDAQEGGAAAAAAVHAVPGEAAAAGASVAETAPAAMPADTMPDAALVSEASAAADSGVAETPTAAAEGSQPDASGAEAKHEEPEQELPKSLDELSQRILDWHWSHLEYGCCAPLHKVIS